MKITLQILAATVFALPAATAAAEPLGAGSLELRLRSQDLLSYTFDLASFDAGAGAGISYFMTDSLGLGVNATARFSSSDGTTFFSAGIGPTVSYVSNLKEGGKGFIGALSAGLGFSGGGESGTSVDANGELFLGLNLFVGDQVALQLGPDLYVGQTLSPADGSAPYVSVGLRLGVSFFPGGGGGESSGALVDKEKEGDEPAAESFPAAGPPRDEEPAVVDEVTRSDSSLEEVEPDPVPEREARDDEDDKPRKTRRERRKKARRGRRGR